MNRDEDLETAGRIADPVTTSLPPRINVSRAEAYRPGRRGPLSVCEPCSGHTTRGGVCVSV